MGRCKQNETIGLGGGNLNLALLTAKVWRKAGDEQNTRNQTTGKVPSCAQCLHRP